MLKFSQNPILSCTPFRWRETDLVQQLLFRVQNSVSMLSNFILAERGGDDTAWGCRFERGVQIQLEQEISRSKLVVVAECSGTLRDVCGYTLEANCSGILTVGCRYTVGRPMSVLHCWMDIGIHWRPIVVVYWRLDIGKQLGGLWQWYIDGWI